MKLGLMWAVLVIGAGALVCAPSAQADNIDLNDFYYLPGDPVTVAADGSSALIEEDPVFSPILLVNDPAFGDPEVILPGAGATLSFDFDFVEGATANNDEFAAFLVNGDGSGASMGAPYEFFATSTSSGTVTFDLSGLTSYTLGLQFQLSALPGDVSSDSYVTVSNVCLEGATPPPVPEPASIALFSAAATGLALRRRRRKAVR